MYPAEAKGVTIKWAYNRDKKTFGWYDPRDGAISLNKSVFSSWAEALVRYDRTVKSRESPAGTTADAVFYHEFGHRVWHYRNGFSDLTKPIDKVFYNFGFGYVGAGYRNELLERELSSYAAFNAHPRYREAIAEAFAEWYNSPSPRRFCEALLKEVGILS